MTLFLGGPANGQRIVVPDTLQGYVIPIPQPIRRELTIADAPRVMDRHEVVYKRMRFGVDGQTASVFVPQAWSQSMVSQALIAYLEFG